MKHINNIDVFLNGKDWYHGSDYKFDSFETYEKKGSSALGFFVTDDLNLAEFFGEFIYKVKITNKNPFKITMDKWDNIRLKYAKNTEYFIKMRNDLIEKGYDSIFIKERTWTSSNGIVFKDGNIQVLFFPKNIIIQND